MYFKNKHRILRNVLRYNASLIFSDYQNIHALYNKFSYMILSNFTRISIFMTTSKLRTKIKPIEKKVFAVRNTKSNVDLIVIAFPNCEHFD